MQGQNREMNYSEWIKLKLTNNLFYITEKLYQFKNKDVQMFGVTHQYDKFKEIFNDQIWFTYRYGFPILYKSSNQNYITDNGWGCMLRTSQMMMAEVIKRHKKDYSKIKIIRMFMDSEIDAQESPFSIQQITILAKINYRQELGEWFNALTSILTLRDLNNLNNNFDMQQIIPNNNYKNSIQRNKFIKNLEFVIFKENVIFIQEIVEKCFQKNQMCQKCLNYVSNKDVSIDDQNILKFYLQNLCCKQWENSLFITLVTKLGIDEPNPIYFPVVKYLLNSEQSVGILGGRPKKALYFIGQTDDSLVYLDPHFVQESQQTIILENIHTYQCDNPQKIKFSQIDSSLSFGFYIQNEQELEKFIDYIYQGNQLCEEWIFSIMASETIFSEKDIQDIEGFTLID